MAVYFTKPRGISTPTSRPNSTPAASNRGIDEIRRLRDRVGLAPMGGRYKVYLIDEVHMLTQEAYNALLKTLEEPPPHVIFVLATTEPHRLPATIVAWRRS